jgi:hypothetical protein
MQWRDYGNASYGKTLPVLGLAIDNLFIIAV